MEFKKAIIGPLQKALIREKLEGVISLKSLYDLFISLFPTPCNVNNPREGGIWVIVFMCEMLN